MGYIDIYLFLSIVAFVVAATALGLAYGSYRHAMRLRKQAEQSLKNKEKRAGNFVSVVGQKENEITKLKYTIMHLDNENDDLTAHVNLLKQRLEELKNYFDITGIEDVNIGSWFDDEGKAL